MRSGKEQKAPGEDGGLFDVQDATGDLLGSDNQIATDAAEVSRADAPPAEGMIPLFDDENTGQRVGWLDPKTGKVEKAKAEEDRTKQGPRGVEEPQENEYDPSDEEGSRDVRVRGNPDAVPVRGRERVRALGIAESVVQHGSAAFVGRQVPHPKELAELAQVYRDPRYETFRVFFIKNGKVAHATGVTARLPGEAPLLPGNQGFQNFTAWLAETMQSTGADGYYLLHNHPSGDPQPSATDVNVTARTAKKIPGFLGLAPGRTSQGHGLGRRPASALVCPKHGPA